MTAPMSPHDGTEPTLLAIVSEKTGYPAEMLNLDMSLDADLGIDSIKRVEILSALQEKLPSAPVIKPDQLGTLQTLRQVANFLSASSPVAAPPIPSTLDPRPSTPLVEPALLSIV